MQQNHTYSYFQQREYDRIIALVANNMPEKLFAGSHDIPTVGIFTADEPNYVAPSRWQQHGLVRLEGDKIVLNNCFADDGDKSNEYVDRILDACREIGSPYVIPANKGLVPYACCESDPIKQDGYSGELCIEEYFAVSASYMFFVYCGSTDTASTQWKREFIGALFQRIKSCTSAASERRWIDCTEPIADEHQQLIQ